MADYKVSIGADTTQLTKTVTTAISNIKADIKVNITNNDISKVAIDTEKYQQVLAKTAIATTKADIENVKLATSYQKLEQETKKTAIAGENLKQAHLKTATAIDKSTNSNKSFASSLVDSTKKVFKFGLSTAVIGLFTSAVYSAWEEVKNLDSSITELKKVTDLGGESLSNYKQEAYDLASELKTSVTNVTDAVTEFSKAGFTLQESMELGEQALVFSTIADGVVSASDSATLLTQVIKGYNMEISESEHIIDSINSISNNFAVSSSDLNDRSYVQKCA